MANIERKFVNEVISLTGYSSNSVILDEAIARIIELEGGTVVGDYGYDEIWEPGQMIIVGDQDFDQEYLVKSVEAGLKGNFTCHYITLEDFWNYWIDQEIYEPYFVGDPRIREHQALAFLEALGFEYPTVDIFNFEQKTQNNQSKEWNDESILKAEFGYSVRNGISEKYRRETLEKAVRSPNIISLQRIAEHIVSQINLRKRNEKMAPAIKRWEADLQWLKENHYDKSIHSFIFPVSENF